MAKTIDEMVKILHQTGINAAPEGTVITACLRLAARLLVRDMRSARIGIPERHQLIILSEYSKGFPRHAADAWRWAMEEDRNV